MKRLASLSFLANGEVKAHPILSYLVPPIALAAIAWADNMVEGVILTPLLSMATLSILAFFLRPRVMALWCIIYVIFVFFMLRAAYIDPSVEDHRALYVRTIGFVIGSSITFALSRTRWKLLAQADSLRQAMRRLPLAVLISDDSGLIIYANPQAEISLESRKDDLLGQSIFGLTTETQKKGQRIHGYLSLCDSVDAAELETTVFLKNAPNRPVRCRQTGLSVLGHPCIMTVLINDQNAGIEPSKAVLRSPIADGD